MHRIEKVEKEILFSLSHDTRTGSYSMKLMSCMLRTDERKYFFNQRIINMCNVLLQEMEVATRIHSFKK